MTLQVVQPVFNLMAEQIALMGEAGEAPALRLGYDDFNESMWMREVRAGWVQWVAGLWGSLGESLPQTARLGDRVCR